MVHRRSIRAAQLMLACWSFQRRQMIRVSASGAHATAPAKAEFGAIQGSAGAG